MRKHEKFSIIFFDSITDSGCVLDYKTLAKCGKMCVRFTSNCWVSELPRGGAGMAHKIDESFAPITVISPQCYEQNHLFLNFCSVFSQLKRKSSALKCPLYFRYQNGLMHKKSPLSYFFQYPSLQWKHLLAKPFIFRVMWAPMMLAMKWCWCCGIVRTKERRFTGELDQNSRCADCHWLTFSVFVVAHVNC